MPAAPDAGTATVNEDGSVTFVPRTGFVGQAQMAYAITEPGTGRESRARLSVNVTAGGSPAFANGYEQRGELAIAPASEVMNGFPFLFDITDLRLRTRANGGAMRSASAFDFLLTDGGDTKIPHGLLYYDPVLGRAVGIGLRSRSTSAWNAMRYYCGYQGTVTDQQDWPGATAGHLGFWRMDTGIDLTGNGRHFTMPGGIGAGTLFGYPAGVFNGTSHVATTAAIAALTAGLASWTALFDLQHAQLARDAGFFGVDTPVVGQGPFTARQDLEGSLGSPPRDLCYTCGFRALISGVTTNTRTEGQANRLNLSPGCFAQTWTSGQTQDLFSSGLKETPLGRTNGAITGSLVVATGVVSIGGAATGYWPGIMGLVRLLTSRRSDAWILAEQVNRLRPLTMLARGAMRGPNEAAPVVAYPDAASASGTTPVTISPLANDTGTGLALVSASVDRGTVSITSSSTLSYAGPGGGYSGPAYITYTVQDAGGRRSTSMVTVTAAGGSSPAPAPGTLHTFTLHNTSGAAATPAMARLGLAFTKGDVPAGQRLAVRVRDGGSPVAFAAAAAANSWADGSLRSTADGGLVMVDSSPIAAGGSRTYEVYAETGSAAASGFDPFAWLAAHSNDLTVAITNRTGSSSGALPDLGFSLKTAIATTTRREILCDTGRFVRIKAWQKVPQEEHLICEYHLDFWLDETGAPFGLEFAPVLSQHWWVANPFGTTQTKERYTYDATVQYGATTLNTHTSLAHAYYCRWASLRPQDDAQHARKHWIALGTDMPTVRVRYDDASLKRMMKAGYIPPLRLGVNYTSDLYPMTSSYTPLGTNGHRAAINGTGGYVGRGMWGDPDAKLVCRQASATAATAEGAWRTSRVMAQAGLAAFFHVRDHRSTSGVNGGTGAPNRVIPQTFRQATALSLSQSYAGLGSHCVYCKGTANGLSGLTVLTHSAPAGGSGSFSSYDSSHAVNYSAPMAFLEGEAYLADAALSAWNHTTFWQNFNNIGADRGLLYSDVTQRQTGQSIPTGTANQYGTMPSQTGQERALAWCTNLMAAAYAVCADARAEAPFLKNMIRNVDAWLSASFGYLPDTHRARGPAYPQLASGGPRVVSPWMCHWQGMAAYTMHRLADFLPDNARSMTGFEEVGALGGRWIADLAANNPYGTVAYRQMWATDAGGLTLIGEAEAATTFDVTFASNVGTATPPFGLVWRNGDKVRLAGTNDNLTAQTALSGLDFTTLYHMVNVSGSSFQLSLTQDGSPLTIENGTRTFGVTMQDYAITPIGPDGVKYWPGDDNYMIIAYAAFEHAVGEGHPDIAESAAAAGRAFFAPKVADISTFAAWNYDGSNL